MLDASEGESIKTSMPHARRHFRGASAGVARAPAFAALRRGKSQPWAESFNPVGIGKTSGSLPHMTRYSTENSEEPFLLFCQTGLKQVAAFFPTNPTAIRRDIEAKRAFFRENVIHGPGGFGPEFGLSGLAVSRNRG